AAGPIIEASAPAKHILSLLKLPQPGQALGADTQSATHSPTFPTMSKIPQRDWQLVRDPVVTTAPAVMMLQSVLPLSVSAAGVPAAAICHSALVSNRLPTLAQNCCA